MNAFYILETKEIPTCFCLDATQTFLTRADFSFRLFPDDRAGSFI